MTDNKKQYLSELYDSISEELSISNTMMEKAVKSYEAVGNWLGECEPDLDVKIFPQGSFNLGTVIKPLSDKDDYDIDLVCLLSNGRYLTAKEIKMIVGNRLKEHKTYRKMLEKEGKRCWTLQYEEFHMDVLPSVPKNIYYVEPGMTEIRLTHKVDEDIYIDKYSNPCEYRRWFESRMGERLYEVRYDYSVKNSVEIDEVPIYKVKTPLQKSIQLLKRHRDIMFADDASGDAPISIIITTLAARAYGGERTVYDALERILCHMQDFIEVDENGDYKVMNPVMEEENFADKWNTNPHKVECFNTWLKQAKKDILDSPMTEVGTVEQGKLIMKSFGENITKLAYGRVGDNARNMREESGLYINGLKGGITAYTTDTSKEIPKHTFYGRK